MIPKANLFKQKIQDDLCSYSNVLVACDNGSRNFASLKGFMNLLSQVQFAENKSGHLTCMV